MSRPVIVGMNNPLGSDPRHALYPHPAGCAGYRLWKLLEERTGASRSQYLSVFDRRNLLPTREWTGSREARRAAEAILPDIQGRTILLLGAEVRKAFGQIDLQPGDFVDVLVFSLSEKRWRFYYLPHPSGRNLWYNDEANRQLASGLLANLYNLQLTGD